MRLSMNCLCAATQKTPWMSHNRWNPLTLSTPQSAAFHSLGVAPTRASALGTHTLAEPRVYCMWCIASQQWCGARKISKKIFALLPWRREEMTVLKSCVYTTFGCYKAFCDNIFFDVSCSFPRKRGSITCVHMSQKALLGVTTCFDARMNGSKQSRSCVSHRKKPRACVPPNLTFHRFQ